MDFRNHLLEAEEEFLGTHTLPNEDFQSLIVNWQHMFHHVNSAFNLILRDSERPTTGRLGLDEFHLNSLFPARVTDEFGGRPDLAFSHIVARGQSGQIELSTPMAEIDAPFGDEFCRTVQKHFPIITFSESASHCTYLTAVGRLGSSLFSSLLNDSVRSPVSDSELHPYCALIVALNTSFTLQTEPWFYEHCITTRKIIWRGDLKWACVSPFADRLLDEQ
jgi:hypothetical protein